MSGVNTVLRPRRKGVWVAALAALAALAAVPVVSGATGSKQASPAAAALVKQAMAPVTNWIGPTSAPPLVKGKTIGVIPCATFVEGCAREQRGVVEAAKAAGWKTIVIDGKGDPQVQQKAMNSLIARKVDAIVLNSINATSVGEAMSNAKKAGIPVIVSFAQNPKPFGGLEDVRIDDVQAGKVAAAYIVTHGGGNVVAVYDNSAEEVVQRYDGLKAGLGQFGGGKLIGSEKISGSQIGPSEAKLMSSYLQRYAKGKINWVFCGYDFMCTPLIQEIDRSGRNEIKAIAYDGNLENLAFIRKGTVQAAAVGYPLEWAGWAVVDELNRHFNSQKLWPGTKYFNFRLLETSNLPPEGKSYEGDIDFRAKFRGLWNVK
jgi:ribose transport system substrate-binding protein